MSYRLSLAGVVLPLAALFLIPVSAAAQGGSGELPGAKPAAPGTKPKTAKEAAPVVTSITLNQAIESRLDPRSSDKIASGNFFQQYDWTAAKAQDHYSLKLETQDPNILVQVFDKENVEIPLARDADTFSIKTQSGGLPADGDYVVRVSGQIRVRRAVPFTLSVNRLGLLPNIYNERFQNIILKFRETDPASVDETLTKLEELAADDDQKPGAFEFLGIIRLYNKGDFENAEKAMDQAIKANGAAVIRISHDKQWRKMVKAKNGDFNWQEPQTGWLRIRPGNLLITDFSNRTLAKIESGKVIELSSIMTADNNMVSVLAEGEKRPYIFMPGTKKAAEADLVIKLIQNHVMGKAN